MKLVAVSLSDKCIKSPRCSFCYLKGEMEEKWLWGVLSDLHSKYPRATFCFEYNGYNLHTLFELDFLKQKTMTTMPLVVSDTFCGAVKKHGVKAISLSYDSEKCSKKEWLEKALIIKKSKMGLGCNFLLEHIPANVPAEILETADQLNLLVKKPDGRLNEKELEILRLEIENYKSFCKVTTDNCLAVQLGFIKKCMAGEDFLHVHPDGTIDKCCFRNDCYLFKEER